MARTKTANAPAKQPESLKTETKAKAAAGAPAYDLDALLSEARVESVNVPSMSPPNDVLAEEGGTGITAWQNNKKITAMWCNSSPRNAYAAISGLGWRKLSDANDSAFLSMVMMASHAETTGATVNVNIGSGGEIHEIYVW